MRGTCIDMAGDLANAATAYQEALARDANVGVSRRLDQIRAGAARIRGRSQWASPETRQPQLWWSDMESAPEVNRRF
jgi:hypothetical protein